MTKKEEIVDRYKNCLLHMYSDANERFGMASPKEYNKTYGTNPNLTTALIRLNYLKREGSHVNSVYTWIGREPDESMALEAIKELHTPNTKSKVPEPVIVAMPSLPSPPKVMKKKEMVPVQKILDKIFDGINLAKKYGVPEDQWRDFVLDVYYKQKKNDQE